MCGKRLNRTWLVLALLLLPLWVSFSDADASCEEILGECVTRLETTTNELENALNTIDEWRSLTREQNELVRRQRTLIADQRATIEERDERLRRIENLFGEFVATTRREKIRSGIVVGAASFVAGLIGGIIVVGM